MTSLLIGRWNYLHAGHRALIQAVLDEGRAVCVAVRDTPHDHEPTAIRVARLREVFPQATVVVVPDVDEVVHGRDVGWTVRAIALDAETEAVSATKIHEACA